MGGFNYHNLLIKSVKFWTIKYHQSFYDHYNFVYKSWNIMSINSKKRAILSRIFKNLI